MASKSISVDLDHTMNVSEGPSHDTLEAPSSKASSPTRSHDKAPLQKKNDLFSIQFDELFKEARKPAPSGSCSFIQPPDDDVLEVTSSDVDSI